MSRFRSVFVPASIAIALLASGLQLPASAVAMAPPGSSGAGLLRGWTSQAVEPQPELNNVLPAGVARSEEVPAAPKRDSRRVLEVAAGRTPTS
jgi:hypothetical protein